MQSVFSSYPVITTVLASKPNVQLNSLNCTIDQQVHGIPSPNAKNAVSIDCADVFSEASSKALLSIPPDMLDSPDLPELSFLLNDLEENVMKEEGSTFVDGRPCTTNWQQIYSGSTRWGEQMPLPTANKQELQTLESLLHKVQDIVNSTLTHGSSDAVGQTLLQLQELVIQQQQQLASKNAAPAFMSALSSPVQSMTTDVTNFNGFSSHPVMHTASPKSTTTRKGGKRDDAVSAPVKEIQKLSKRVRERKEKFDLLESVLEEKRAQAAELMRQNIQLRRRQKMLDTFIKVRDTELQAYRDMEIASKTGEWEKVLPTHPMMTHYTLEKIKYLDEDTWKASYKYIYEEQVRLLCLFNSLPHVTGDAAISVIIKDEPESLTTGPSMKDSTTSSSAVAQWSLVSAGATIQSSDNKLSTTSSSAVAQWSPVSAGDTIQSSDNKLSTTSSSAVAQWSPVSAGDTIQSSDNKLSTTSSTLIHHPEWRSIITASSLYVASPSYPEQPADLSALSIGTAFQEEVVNETVEGNTSLMDIYRDPQEQLEDFSQNMNKLRKCIQFINPTFVHNMAVSSSNISYPPLHWHQVLGTCTLNEEQSQDLLMMDKILTQFNQRVLEDRQQLMFKLTEQVQVWQSSHKLVTSTRVDLDHVVIMEQLKKNMLRDRCLNFLASEVFFFHILSTLQRFTIFVASYPRIPNKLAIIQEFLEQVKQQEVKQQGMTARAGEAAGGGC
ncbi:hypothetical protein CEUSTIGMA_g5868.t1 [Chlamydomonas eustigma]|uniref:BZIP domain-containing protein n=1 Tax=Chlamydomonas eustigma TaxID=1157962 RepID=A0A250X5Q6_9CHLO|nr:hypothetical protein CEUSTIGMA_g5868.t1 [Chlamydomonas eustigma]|eukprot:GAX78427.1 hypothetical protein CEUSTIGMA_g5868.t1 [Chlamydomonas eustigma]